jgi:ABC-type phosphate transport system substrate-binding protein
MKRAFTALVLTLAVAAANAAAPQSGFRVVVNASNPATSLTRASVARMFMKKITEWPDGSDVAPVDQERTSEVRDTFSREIHQRDADAVSAYWQTLVYSGRETPPPIKRSDAEVLDYVRSNPGAIGYVSDAASLDGVKTVAVR